MMRDDDTMEGAQRQQFLGIVVAETERLSRLVNQVLDMAKIEAGHAEWHETAVDMRELLHQVTAGMVEPLRERGINLSLVIPAQVEPLQADADRITQVVLNLLSNAAKYAPPGRGQIDLTLTDAPDAVQVQVRDNGPGIPLEQQAKVFERFRQVSGDEHYRPGGTGLGLPISRQIVEHFGGQLWLQSQPGQGACFAFSLPRRTVQT
jgi:hypothetical protein